MIRPRVRHCHHSAVFPRHHHGPHCCLSLSSGVLKLSQQGVPDSADVVPACVSLLPKQTYLNVNEDAAGTLERKRNYIYCLIVHILKREKEMHIDNLVFKVRL